jgi:hypothetical protein
MVPTLSLASTPSLAPAVLSLASAVLFVFGVA